MSSAMRGAHAETPGHRRPTSLPGHRVVAGALLAAVALPALTVVLARSGTTSGCPACCSSTCSWWSSSRRSAASGRRSPPRSRASSLGELVLHAAALHVHDRRGREPARARDLPRRRRDRERLRLPRRASRERGAARACRGRDASRGSAGPRPSSRSSSRSAGPSRSTASRCGTGTSATGWWTRRCGAHAERARGADGASDEGHVLALVGARRPGRRAPVARRVRDGARGLHPDRGARGGGLRGRRRSQRVNELRARDPFGRFARPAHAPRRRSRRP